MRWGVCLAEAPRNRHPPKRAVQIPWHNTTGESFLGTWKRKTDFWCLIFNLTGWSPFNIMFLWSDVFSLFWSRLPSNSVSQCHGFHHETVRDFDGITKFLQDESACYLPICPPWQASIMSQNCCWMCFLSKWIHDKKTKEVSVDHRL